MHAHFEIKRKWTLYKDHHVLQITYQYCIVLLCFMQVGSCCLYFLTILFVVPLNRSYNAFVFSLKPSSNVVCAIELENECESKRRCDIYVRVWVCIKLNLLCHYIALLLMFLLICYAMEIFHYASSNVKCLVGVFAGRLFVVRSLSTTYLI